MADSMIHLGYYWGGPESKYIVWESSNDAMEIDISSTQSCSLLFRKKVNSRIDVSVCPPLWFFISIHTIVDGHTMKVSILLAT